MWKKSFRNYRICLRETNHSFESISKDLARNITANTEDISKLVSSGTISAKSDGMEKAGISFVYSPNNFFVLLFRLLCAVPSSRYFNKEYCFQIYEPSCRRCTSQLSLLLGCYTAER